MTPEAEAYLRKFSLAQHGMESLTASMLASVRERMRVLTGEMAHDAIQNAKLDGTFGAREIRRLRLDVESRMADLHSWARSSADSYATQAGRLGYDGIHRSMGLQGLSGGVFPRPVSFDDIIRTATDKITGDMSRRAYAGENVAQVGQSAARYLTIPTQKNAQFGGLSYQIARTLNTESRSAFALGIQDAGQAMGLTGPKVWLHAPFTKEARPDHVRMHGKVSERGTFDLNGIQCLGPHDPVLPPGEVINCACTAIPWRHEWGAGPPLVGEYEYAEGVPYLEMAGGPKSRIGQVVGVSTRAPAAVSGELDRQLARAAEMGARVDVVDLRLPEHLDRAATLARHFLGMVEAGDAPLSTRLVIALNGRTATGLGSYSVELDQIWLSLRNIDTYRNAGAPSMLMPLADRELPGLAGKWSASGLWPSEMRELGVLTHEVGHAKATAAWRTRGVSEAEAEMRAPAIQHKGWEQNHRDKTLTAYSRTNWQEAEAEAFALRRSPGYAFFTAQEKAVIEMILDGWGQLAGGGR